MSKIEVNTVEPQCGTTLTVGKACGSVRTASNNIQASDGGNLISQCGTAITLGASGDTINLASGASQSGFGRTGTVDWVTDSIKTATFTAVSGKGYFCNTTGGAFEMDLPAGAAGSIVSVQDYNNTFDTYNLTVDPNGSEKINGGDAGEPVELKVEGQGVTFVYVDSTVGWRSVQDNLYAQSGASYITATGGNAIVTCGNYKTHIFTAPGTFCVSSVSGNASLNAADYLVVAGGGGGGRDNYPGSRIGGGGGGGGFRISNSVGCIPAPTMSPLVAPAGLTIAASPYPITVGSGGAAGTPSCEGGVRGANSIFSTITSTGGGGGGGHSPSSDSPGTNGPGGSGGANQGSGWSGNTPPVSPPQGNNAGSGGAAPSYAGGGGGGAGAVGGNQSGSTGGSGGVGSFLACASIGPSAPGYGTPGPAPGRYFAGGGGTKLSGAGGAGGGTPASPGGADGTVNTGGGGGGRNNCLPAAGGSGIVIIRYKYQ
jgi:hypothetical protein